MDRLDLPGQVVTSVMFGGPELDIIYVTTVLSDEDAAGSPDAGRTLAISGTGYRGLPESRFHG